jgi:hypothetical protein
VPVAVPGWRIVLEPVSFVPAVEPIPLPVPELPSVVLSFFIRDRPSVLFVPLMPLPDAPPCSLRQVPRSRPVRFAHCSGVFALADGACIALPPFIAPDVVADGVPEVVADGVPEVVADGVPEVVADGVPDVVADGVPEVVADVVPDVVADVLPDVVPVAAPAETANASATAAASVHDPMCFICDSSCLELATPESK